LAAETILKIGILHTEPAIGSDKNSGHKRLITEINGIDRTIFDLQKKKIPSPPDRHMKGTLLIVSDVVGRRGFGTSIRVKLSIFNPCHR
jgi:hypothetical protein